MNSTADTGAADRDEWYFAKREDEYGNTYTVYSVKQRPINEGREFLFDWSLKTAGGTFVRATTVGELNRYKDSSIGCRNLGGYFDDDHFGVFRRHGYDESVDPKRLEDNVAALLLYCIDASVFMPYLCEEYVDANEVGIGNPFEPWPAAETEVSA